MQHHPWEYIIAFVCDATPLTMIECHGFTKNAKCKNLTKKWKTAVRHSSAMRVARAQNGVWSGGPKKPCKMGSVQPLLSCQFIKNPSVLSRNM